MWQGGMAGKDTPELRRVMDKLRRASHGSRRWAVLCSQARRLLMRAAQRGTVPAGEWALQDGTQRRLCEDPDKDVWERRVLRRRNVVWRPVGGGVRGRPGKKAGRKGRRRRVDSEEESEEEEPPEWQEFEDWEEVEYWIRNPAAGAPFTIMDPGGAVVDGLNNEAAIRDHVTGGNGGGWIGVVAAPFAPPVPRKAAIPIESMAPPAPMPAPVRVRPTRPAAPKRAEANPAPVPLALEAPPAAIPAPVRLRGGPWRINRPIAAKRAEANPLPLALKAPRQVPMAVAQRLAGADPQGVRAGVAEVLARLKARGEFPLRIPRAAVDIMDAEAGRPVVPQPAPLALEAPPPTQAEALRTAFPEEDEIVPAPRYRRPTAAEDAAMNASKPRARRDRQVMQESMLEAAFPEVVEGPPRGENAALARVKLRALAEESRRKMHELGVPVRRAIENAKGVTGYHQRRRLLEAERPGELLPQAVNAEARLREIEPAVERGRQAPQNQNRFLYALDRARRTRVRAFENEERVAKEQDALAREWQEVRAAVPTASPPAERSSDVGDYRRMLATVPVAARSGGRPDEAGDMRRLMATVPIDDPTPIEFNVEKAARTRERKSRKKAAVMEEALEDILAFEEATAPPARPPRPSFPEGITPKPRQALPPPPIEGGSLPGPSWWAPPLGLDPEPVPVEQGPAPALAEPVQAQRRPVPVVAAPVPVRQTPAPVAADDIPVQQGLPSTTAGPSSPIAAGGSGGPDEEPAVPQEAPDTVRPPNPQLKRKLDMNEVARSTAKRVKRQLDDLTERAKRKFDGRAPLARGRNVAIRVAGDTAKRMKVAGRCPLPCSRALTRARSAAGPTPSALLAAM